MTRIFEDGNLFVMVVDEVLAPEECQRLIDGSEKQGYIQAVINKADGREVMDVQLHDSHRTIADDPAFAMSLFVKLKSVLPQTLQGHDLACINERMRFLRYDVGQRFRLHTDGCYRRPDGSEVSYLTLQVYLNGVAEELRGGETILHHPVEDQTYRVHPRPGRVVVFDHGILHEGALVTAGRKYCIRTDVMYGNKSTSQ